MQKISKEDANQNFIGYSSNHPEAITVDEKDYSLILNKHSIFFTIREMSTSDDIYIDLKNSNALKAEAVLINFTLFEDYTIIFISKIMEKIYNLIDENADVMFSTTPIKECAKDYIKLDIYLGLN